MAFVFDQKGKVFNKSRFDYIIQWWLTDGQIDRLFARADQLDDVIAWRILDVLAVNPPDLVTW